MAEWGYWVIGIAAFWLGLDIHKRVSQIGDRLHDYERKVAELQSALDRLQRLQP